jgi:hypothetical protein
MACTKDHTDNLPKSQITKIEESQKSWWRHRCAGCAYELGRRHAAEAEERLRTRVRALMDEVDGLKAELTRRTK